MNVYQVVYQRFTDSYGYLEQVTELVTDDVYLSEEKAEKNVPTPNMESLHRLWREKVDESDKRYKTRLANERRALTRHRKRQAVLQESGLSAGKEPAVQVERRHDEEVLPFGRWMEGRDFHEVLTLIVTL